MSHFKQRIDLFKIKPFRNYVFSCALAMFGNGLTYVAMTWALLKGSHEVEAVAILMTCFWLPNIVLGPLAGVIVDKYPRKTLLLFCNLSRAVVLTLFYFLYKNTSPAYAIYTLAMITGSVLAIYIPAAMTLVREIVSKKDLLYANATVDMAYEIGAVAGMGVSGLVIAMTSIQATFFINAIFYIFAALTLLGIYSSRVNDIASPQHHFMRDFISGFKYLVGKPELKTIYAIQMLFFVSYMTAPILLAPYAKAILHTNVAQFGYIEAGLSVGAVIGGIFSPYLCEKIGFFKVMFLETLLCCLSFYFFGHNVYIPVAIILYFFIGYSFSAWPILITAAQDKTDLKYQGRVQSLFGSVSGILILIFYIILGYVGDDFPIKTLYWIEVSLMVSSMLLLLHYKKAHPE